MKKLNSIREPRLNKVLLCLLAVVTILGSCKKDDNDVILEGEAKVMLVNASESSAPQDFYLDGTKRNPDPVVYNEATAYITTDAGYERKAEFKDAGSASANFTGYIDLLPEKSYTIFYTTLADGTGSSSAAFEDITATSTTKAKVRFVNLAGGFASANILVSGGSVLASNIDFGKATTNYVELDPGTIALQTAISGTAQPLNIGTFTVAAGKIYTIYTSGSLTSTVSAHMITHN